MIEGLDAALDAALAQVRADPGLRAALEAARAWGVSPSRFLGREPATAVMPALNGSGGWRFVREPEWLEEDRALALAFGIYEADLCPGCRHPLAETTDAAHEFAYRPGAPIRCHRCTVSSMAANAYAEQPHASALLLPIELVEVPAEASEDV